LKSGDIVEILTSPNQKPSKDWLNFVVTSKARNKIRSALRSAQRERSHKLGVELLEQALEQRSLSIEKVTKSGEMDNLIRLGKESNQDDLFIAIGYGKIDPLEIVTKAFPKQEPKLTLEQQAQARKLALAPTPKRRGLDTNHDKAKTGILVSGMDNVLVNFGRCCNPLPGEVVVGFVTRGRGVTVHRASCSRALDLDPQRRIDVAWADEGAQGLHTAYVRILTRDRTGVLAEVTSAISNCGANVQKAEVHVNKDLLGVLDFELSLHGLAQLEAVITKIENIPAVINVERKSVLNNKKAKGKK
jgi:GTP pyrophosphokinase